MEHDANTLAFLSQSGIHIVGNQLVFRPGSHKYSDAKLQSHLDQLQAALYTVVMHNRRYTVSVHHEKNKITVKIASIVVATYEYSWFFNHWKCKRENQVALYLTPPTLSQVAGDLFDIGVNLNKIASILR